MNLDKYRDFVRARGFADYRNFVIADFRKEYSEKKYNFSHRSCKIFEYMCRAEVPIVITGEKITFTRSTKNVPYYFDDKSNKSEFKDKNVKIYDVVHNITPNYDILLKYGLKNRLEFCKNQLNNIEDSNKKSFYKDVICCINAFLGLVRKYEIASREAGNSDVSEILKRVPIGPASSFREALQAIRLVTAAFYLCDNYQIGFGRFDRYMWPYYKNDLNKGVINREQAYELLKEFFISINKDTDLYRGVQQGDNGQSLMLGGCDETGASSVNDLTYLVLEVARDLRLIDPKINLRIDRNTPIELLDLGGELTRVGLGFPQYSNDEVVIPALVNKGYSLEDARNYTVAACWEFIIPGKGMDVVNLGAVSFPAAVEKVLTSYVDKGVVFELDDIFKLVKVDVKKQIQNILKERKMKILPSPFMSIFMDGALESGIDASVSAKYHNIGIHGAGISDAVDSICVAFELLRRNGINDLVEIIAAKRNNFNGYDFIKTKVESINEKCGNNTELSNSVMMKLFETFAEAAEELSTDHVKIRPGSGSAQFYVWLTKKVNNFTVEPIVGASINGRKAGEALSSSLAPSSNVKVNGLLSVINAFSHINYSRIMNGGPITIELSPTVFNAENGIRKLSNIIQYFVKLRNQQLQINVLNIDELEDAVKHPELHRNLIVRVWGWSGYFCELSPEYQKQILARHRYQI